MKQLLILLCLFLFTSTVFALDINGDFTFQESWFVNKGIINKNQDNFHTLNIVAEKEFNNINFKVSAKMRIYDYWTNIQSNPTLDLWNTYVQVNDIILSGLSLKAGNQLFEWGTADGIHPSSIINPNDWSNPFGMGNTIPIFAMNLNYTYDFLQLFFIWIPSFKSSVFPKYFQMFNSKEFSIPDMILTSISEITKLPDANKRDERALKLNFSFSTIDFSFGFFSGYDSMPQIQDLNYIPISMTQANLTIAYYFPQLEVYTADFSTSILGIGLWGEVGLYDYNKEDINIIVASTTNKETILDGKPYATYVMGMDYNFVNGWYINAQYSYGLSYVRGWRNFEDYILTALKFPIGDFMNINLGSMFGFKRGKEIKNNYEYMLTQQLDYDISDNLTLSCFVSEIDAYGFMLFKSWENYDSFGFEMKYNF